MQKIGRIIAGIVAGVLILAVLGLIVLLLIPPVGEDATLRTAFFNHRQEFEQLKTMILAEPLADGVGTQRVGSYYIHGEKWKENSNDVASISINQKLSACGLTQEKFKLYLDLLKKIGSSEIVKGPNYDPKAKVRLWYDSSGIVGSGIQKDIIWAPEKPTGAIVSDTKHNTPDMKVLNAPLENGWYIQLIRD